MYMQDGIVARTNCSGSELRGERASIALARAVVRVVKSMNSGENTKASFANMVNLRKILHGQTPKPIQTQAGSQTKAR